MDVAQKYPLDIEEKKALKTLHFSKGGMSFKIRERKITYRNAFNTITLSYFYILQRKTFNLEILHFRSEKRYKKKSTKQWKKQPRPVTTLCQQMREKT